VRAAGYDPRVAAIDMPVSTRGRILARRTCDNLIASVFGRFKLAAHGPTIVENVLHADYPAAFAEQGFTLCVRHDCDAITPRLIEAYPHCVMLRLMRAKKRVPYKVSRSLSYWPGTTAAERAERILDTWRSIVTALEAELPGAAQALDLPMRATTLASLKRHEDALDALVCAWLATRFLDAREELVCLGDGETSAIWCPAPDG
jgi:predicted RNase H-like nuclease